MLAYLNVKKAFSVRPATAVAMASRNVVVPKVECIGTRAALKLAVADSQHRRRRKLNTPTRNYKHGKLVRILVLRVRTCHDWLSGGEIWRYGWFLHFVASLTLRLQDWVGCQES